MVAEISRIARKIFNLPPRVTMRSAVYAYKPAGRLPDTKAGTFTRALYDAKGKGWTVISMKNDRKHIFAFES